MATTGHWYINPDGTKADFTDPSVDINAAAGTVTRELRKVTAVAGTWPQVTLWKGAAAAITSGEIAAAIADQDSAAVPQLNDTPETPGSQQASISDLSAPAIVGSVQEATVNGSDLATTQALANSLKVKYNAAQLDIVALRATVALLVTAVDALITRLEVAGIDITV